MLGRVVLTQLCRNRALNARVPSRGKALDNWHRPTMAEYGVPTKAWGPEAAKRCVRSLLHLNIPSKRLHNDIFEIIEQLSF